MPFDSTKHYEDYIARLNQVPRLLDQLTDVLKQGEKDKLMPPRFLLEKTASQIEGIANQKPEETPFVKPLTKIPDALRAELIAAVRDDVLPAYVKLGKFVREEYAPQGREHPGVARPT